jgi:hypothetical protein
MMEVHISRNGDSSGPFSFEELTGLVETGDILEEDFAWKEGIRDWTPVLEFIETHKPSADSDPAPRPLPQPGALKAAVEVEKPKFTAPSLSGPISKPAAGGSIYDSPPPRSRKLRGPGDDPLPPTATGASVPAPTTLKSNLNTSVVSSAKLSAPSSAMPMPDEIKRESAMPEAVRAALAKQPKIKVRKKPGREYQVSYFRIIGVGIFAIVLYGFLIPFLRMEDGDGVLVGEKFSAAQLALEPVGSSELMGIEMPKGVPEFGRLLIVCGLIGGLILSYFFVRSAFKPLGVVSSNGLILCLITAAVIGGLGHVYGTKLEESVAETGAVLTMDVGFYMALSAAIIGLALVIAPDYSSVKKMFSLYLPVVLLLGGAGFTMWYGLKQCDFNAPTISEASDSMSAFMEKLKDE